jgi:DNA polymerase-1
MTATELLDALRICGAEVRLDGGDLVVRSPRGAVTPDLRAALIALKPALLAELAKRRTGALEKSAGLAPDHGTEDPWARPTVPCMVCGQIKWRVWWRGEGEGWRRICNACRPLVVYNPDGTVWRSDAQPAVPETVAEGRNTDQKDQNSLAQREAARVDASPSRLELPPIRRLTCAADVEEAVGVLRAAPYVGLDTEATGLDPFVDTQCLLQLATPEVAYVADPGEVDWRLLAPLFAPGGPVIIGHNLKYELRVLRSAGVEVADDVRLYDVGTAARVLEATAKKPAPSYRIESVAERHLGLVLDKSLQMSFQPGPKTPAQIAYAVADAAVCLPLYHHLRPLLVEAGLERIAALEMNIIPFVAWLEHTGLPLDREAWERLAAAAEGEMKRVDETLSGLVGKEGVNWGSGPQLGRILLDRGHRLPLSDKGNPKVDRSALFGLPEGEALRTPLLERSLLKSRTSTYGRGFLKHVHPATGRLHGDWNALGSEAGRMSCRDVPLQGLPRQDPYRSGAKARAGRALVKGDFGHIEFDLAAQIARELKALRFLREGKDPHYQTTSMILGKPVEAVTKHERQRAKAVNFGLIYGMGAARLVQYAHESYGVVLSLAEAAQWRKRFFAHYTGFRCWHRERPKGSVETRTILGRRRLDVAQFTEKCNSPVQGSGSDGLKLALALLWQRRHEIPSAVPVACSHDEVLLECNADDAEAVQAVLSDVMREGMSQVLTAVEPVVEAGAFADWGVTPLARTEGG